MEPLLETIDLDVEESNELLFKIKVEGIEQAPARVRMVCEVGDISYMFTGQPTGDDGLVQFILPILKDKIREGTYLSRVEVLIENRYFAPINFNVNFKKAVTVVAESVQLPQRKPVPQVTVTAVPVVVKKPTVTAEARETRQTPGNLAPPASAPKKPAPPPAPSTLKERRAIREKVINEVDDDSADLIKELARGFMKGKR